MGKLNKKHMIITMVLLTIVISILGFFLRKEEPKLELLGSPEESIMINSLYEDKGVNLKDAELKGSINTKKAGTYTLEGFINSIK